MKSTKHLESQKTTSFWDTDLEDIESEFLDKNQKITDLPTHLDRKVPHQGSVLLDKVVRLDSKPNKSFFKRISLFFR